MKLRNVMFGTMAAMMLLTGCGAPLAETAPEAPPTPVEVLAAAPVGIMTELVYAGQLTANETVSVMPKSQGKVKTVHFEVGDAVNAGDVLFTLDEQAMADQIQTLEAQYNQAAQTVATAQNALNNVTGGAQESKILQQDTSIESYEKQLAAADTAITDAQMGITAAEVALSDAQTAHNAAFDAYNDTKALFDNGIVSQAQLDQSQRALEQATAGLERATLALEQANSRLSQAQLGKEQAQSGLDMALKSKDLLTGQLLSEGRQTASLGVATAQSTAEVARVALENARDQLLDLSVKSPISGVVSIKNAKPEEYATLQAPAFVIIDTNKLKVEVNVSELLINKIAVGDSVDLYIKSLSDAPYQATVSTIAPATDQSNTYPVTLELSNPDGSVKPGMFAEVRFIREENKTAIALPLDAVMSDDNGSYVYLNDNGISKYTPVTTGINNGRYVEIVSGLNEGQEVIARGQTYVFDGGKINVVGTVSEGDVE